MVTPLADVAAEVRDAVSADALSALLSRLEVTNGAPLSQLTVAAVLDLSVGFETASSTRVAATAR